MTVGGESCSGRGGQEEPAEGDKVKIEKAHLASNGDPLDSWLFLDENLSSLYRLIETACVHAMGLGVPNMSM